MPHTIAEQAVAATHELARLTRPAITPLDAAEIAVLAQTLTRLAAGLCQTLTQLSNYNDADHASANLQQAATAARCLVAALNTANHHLGDTAEPDSEPEGVNFQPTKRGQISTGVDRSPRSWPWHRRASVARNPEVEMPPRSPGPTARSSKITGLPAVGAIRA